MVDRNLELTICGEPYFACKGDLEHLSAKSHHDSGNGIKVCALVLSPYKTDLNACNQLSWLRVVPVGREGISGEADLSEDLNAMYDECVALIQEHNITAIIPTRDTPALLHAALATEPGLSLSTMAPSVDSIVVCNQKLYTHLSDDSGVHFGHVVVDGARDFTPDVERMLAANPALQFPLFAKPSDGVGSMHTRRVNSVTDAAAHLESVAACKTERQDSATRRFLLSHAPATASSFDLAGLDVCLFEEYVESEKVTTDGYVFRGEVHCFAIVDNVYRTDNPGAFHACKTPSAQPTAVQEQLRAHYISVVEQLRDRHGLDNCLVDVEQHVRYSRDGTLTIQTMEINPRMFAQFEPVYEATFHHGNLYRTQLQLQLPEMLGAPSTPMPNGLFGGNFYINVFNAEPHKAESLFNFARVPGLAGFLAENAPAGVRLLRSDVRCLAGQVVGPAGSEGNCLMKLNLVAGSDEALEAAFALASAHLLAFEEPAAPAAAA